MAVYTKINQAELCDLLSHYEIGAVQEIKEIVEGVENSNFSLQTEQGKFILTLYEKRVNPDDLPFFLNLKKHLNTQNISCPLPIARKDGGLLSNVKGQPAAIISFLEGSSIRRPQNIHCYELGKAMAELHLAGQSFNMHRGNDVSLEAWQTMFDEIRGDCDSVHPDMRAHLSQDLEFLEQNWPTDLPTGIIHADLFVDNIFFIDEKLSGIIDFYFACTDMFAYDIAIALNAWCFEADVNFNITKSKAILEGYQSTRPLSEAEFTALPILARGAAMRFLLTRLQDWLHQDPHALVGMKNPTDYLRRLRFHKTVTHAQDYAITRKI